MTPSQHRWIAAQLTEKGTITRNQCLNRLISRLAARIADLRAAGWKIEGAPLPTKYGTDYQYTLISKP